MAIKALFSPTTNREDWTDEFEVRDLETGELFDLTGGEITLAISRHGGATLTFSLTSGVSVPDIGTIAWTIPAAAMSGLCPGNYAVGCVMTRAGTAKQIFTGVLPVIDGVLP